MQTNERDVEDGRAETRNEPGQEVQRQARKERCMRQQGCLLLVYAHFPTQTARSTTGLIKTSGIPVCHGLEANGLDTHAVQSSSSRV
jgi:hypothetical protein